MQNTTTVCGLFLALALWGPATAEAAGPLALHPENPHYLLFRGKPTVLVTSGEHYGAVLNLDFDYVRYLDELRSREMNLTRTFSGTYREVPGSFGITENTLAPAGPDRFACPWARSSTPGAGDGGAKFDLGRWNPAYFQRLKDFLSQAGQRGIVVELSLFCAIYDEKLWAVNPMNAANNTGGVGKVSRKEVYALKEPALTAVQDAFVKKVVEELKDCDNVYYEICNEPYAGSVKPAWTRHVADLIAAAEGGFPARHLIAENVANGSAKIVAPPPQVSIFNFHYASPPDTVGINYALGKAIADDETGFKGKGDFWYRREGWEFLLAGGAIYSNLDYSFTCSHPDGTAKITTSPGGGGPELRRQLAILKSFLDGFDLVRMKPRAELVRASQGVVRALVEEGKAYAIYVHGGTRTEVTLPLPAGSYRAEWINTKTGGIDRAEDFRHSGGPRTIASPAYPEDVALRLKRAD
jgi:hypothetical protein